MELNGDMGTHRDLPEAQGVAEGKAPARYPALRWYQSLTRRQRLVLLSLSLALVTVIALFTWSVWSALQAEVQQPASPDAVPLPQATSTGEGGAPPLPGDAATPSPLPLAQPTPTQQIEAAPTFDVFRAGVIAANVADARESRTRWGTPLTLVDLTGMARALHTHYQARPPLVLRMQPALEVLNLWVCDTASPDCRVRLDVVTQAKETAAFYAPESAELYLRREWDGSLSTLEQHLAYGYARALPDQFGDISTLMAEATSLDLQLALTGVVEGEALVSLWLLNDVVPAGLSVASPEADALRAEIRPVICAQWQVDDPRLRELSCLAFDLGVPFVNSQYQQGGVAALDELILRPPRSTEQMLHSERYAASDEPRAIAPLAPALGSGWQLATTETLGEALMGWVFAAWRSGSGGENGEDVPETPLGWGGDLLQIWRTADGAWVAAWQIYLDDARVAARLYGRLVDLLPQPLLDGRILSTVSPASLLGGRWWVDAESAVFLHRRANRIGLVWGPDLDAVERVGIAALPQP